MTWRRYAAYARDLRDRESLGSALSRRYLAIFAYRRRRTDDLLMSIFGMP